MRMRQLLVIGLVGLSACTTWSLEELRETNGRGTPLQNALSKEYLAFSESEAQQYDWVDSKYFADKGLLAAYGNSVQPENPAEWNIEPDKLPKLTAARSRLMQALGQFGAANPTVAARAQYGFDCWVEQQEEAWQTDDIASCRHIFETAMQQLGTDEPTTLPMDAVRTSAYILFFNYDSAQLTAEALTLVERILADAPATPNAVYILNGHADRSGSDRYNQSLSEKRAVMVQDALIAGGIAPDRIQHYAFGESDPDMPTPDGVREPANRRVEIFME